MVSLSPLAGAGWQIFNNNGVPLAGGKLYTYAAGTTTPTTTYTSSDGSIPNANPIILDSAGRVSEQVWLDSTANYKFTLATSLDVTLWTKDNISGIVTFADLANYVTIIELEDLTVNSIAELRTVPIADLVQVTGYYMPGDGGGGAFFWNATATEPDDGGLYILPNGYVGAGRWQRIVEGDVYQAAWWGAKSELGFDNRAVVQAALDALTVPDSARQGYNRGPLLGYGADAGKGSILQFAVGRFDFLSLHPTETDRMLWMRKPIYIQGAGMDRTQFVAEYATTKTWLIVEPLESPPDYMVGGGISNFGFHGGFGAARQNCIEVTAVFPANMKYFSITDFNLYEVNNGIYIHGQGITNVYSSTVARGTILKIASGGRGLFIEYTAYDTITDVEIYEDEAIAGSRCVHFEVAFNICCTNLRWQGCAFIDAPFGTLVGCGIEGGFDFSSTGNVALRIVRLGSATSTIMNGAGNANISSIVRTSAVLATVTTSTPHGMSNGDTFFVREAAPAAYNGSFNATVTGPNTFTYPLLSDPVTNATAVGWFAAVSGSAVIYGITVGGTGIAFDGITYVAKQPGYPFIAFSGSSGSAVNIHLSAPTLYDAIQVTTADAWLSFRISESPTLTAYGWDMRAVTVLPTADLKARGLMRTLLNGTGVADASYACQKNASDVAVWVAL